MVKPGIAFKNYLNGVRKNERSELSLTHSLKDDN